MDNFHGLDLDILRTLTTIGALCAFLLYAYRAYCLVRLLKFYEPNDNSNKQLIYAGLIVFIPLGIGGWIFDYCENDKLFPWLFLVPFVIALGVSAYMFYLIMPVSTSFNMSFLNW